MQHFKELSKMTLPLDYFTATRVLLEEKVENRRAEARIRVVDNFRKKCGL